MNLIHGLTRIICLNSWWIHSSTRLCSQNYRATFAGLWGKIPVRSLGWALVHQRWVRKKRNTQPNVLWDYMGRACYSLWWLFWKPSWVFKANQGQKSLRKMEDGRSSILTGYHLRLDIAFKRFFSMAFFLSDWYCRFWRLVVVSLFLITVTKSMALPLQAMITLISL